MMRSTFNHIASMIILMNLALIALSSGYLLGYLDGFDVGVKVGKIDKLFEDNNVRIRHLEGGGTK